MAALLKSTPLRAVHANLGATFTPFAGYEMPVQYGSIKDEHLAVRSSVGLFDVSHMSNLWLSGDGAADAISSVCPFDAAALPDRKGKYTVVLRDDGTILDDAFVFRVNDDFHMVPNAGMSQQVGEQIARTASAPVTIEDRTEATAILALQGPQARNVLMQASSDDLPKFHTMAEMSIGPSVCEVSGTGYTGEKGVEIFVSAANAEQVWSDLMAAGNEIETPIQPIGLGARDTLRLEKGYALAGNEFAGGRTPLEAGLSWLIDWDCDFIGKAALIEQQEAGHDRLVGLVQPKGVPRAGYKVTHEGAEIGVISSGTMSPSLGHGIALAYCQQVEEGMEVLVEVRQREMPATVVRPPFV